MDGLLVYIVAGRGGIGEFFAWKPWARGHVWYFFSYSWARPDGLWAGLDRWCIPRLVPHIHILEIHPWGEPIWQWRHGLA